MKRGFTLIEVLVTMTIVAILAGMMVPAVWKFWESQEIQTTKDRLNAIKLAMVGNKDLMQNGIRTSYGFVGDNGELPFANSSSSASLSFLVNRPASSYPNWNGPYMSGFEPSEYKVDAWGNAIIYEPVKDSSGRYVSAYLLSAGPDRIRGTSDDIRVSASSLTDYDIKDIEVTPTDSVQGNLRFYFSSNNIGKKFSARLYATVHDPLGISPAGFSQLSSAQCFSVPGAAAGDIASIPLNGATLRPMKLPVGKAMFKSRLYTTEDVASPSCNGNKLDSTELSVFVHDTISTIFVSMPTINY
jgi:prepilin-type N-terminal cleavage/methylation domain-containing protein